MLCGSGLGITTLFTTDWTLSCSLQYVCYSLNCDYLTHSEVDMKILLYIAFLMAAMILNKLLRHLMNIFYIYHKKWKNNPGV